MSDQRKKSRSLAFKNPMRLADEHAAMVEFLRDVFVNGAHGAASPTVTLVNERAEGLLKETDR